MVYNGAFANWNFSGFSEIVAGKNKFWGLGMIVVKLSHQTSNHLRGDPLPPGHSKSEPFYNLFHSMA